MKKKRSDEPTEHDRFTSALKKVLSVPYSEMKSKLEAEKQKRTKKASASRVSVA
jgi:hypothetical protein